MSQLSSIPAPTKDGLTFWPIPEFNDPTCVFGADEKHYFNRYNLPDVPRKYTAMVDELFFRGGTLPEMAPQVDRAKAARAVRAWLSSWAPAHEAKIATVGYAFWVWMTLPEGV